MAPETIPVGSALFEIAVVVAAAWFVWRFIASMLPARQQPAEPESNRDDSSLVGARLRPRPKSGAGAVALAEPDDDQFFEHPRAGTGRRDHPSHGQSARAS